MTISIPTGEPDDLRVLEVSNWSGRGLVFPRVPTQAAKTKGLHQSGLYLLMGEVLNSRTENHMYIGESENVYERLRNHQKKPNLEFWTQTLCFTSPSNTLNKGHLRYMESELIRRARDAASWSIVNSTAPIPAPLSSADEIAADAFLGTVLSVSAILGISAFKQPKSIGGARMFMNGPDTRAEGEDQNGGFLVTAGSLARRIETLTLQDSVRDLRKKLVNDGLLVVDGQSLRLTHDHLFSSPSTAAACFLARSANGRTEWKDSTGRTLREIQESDAD